MRPQNSLLPSFAGLAAVTLISLAPRVAAAHIEITSHTTRHGVALQKAAPCGLAGAEGPGETVYTYAPGETITLAWFEFIDHPGHYRVAFDPDGDDDFITPSASTDLYNNEAVLLDGIPDEDGIHDYAVELTLPDVECESCTLQILQIMTDKPPFGDGNDLYYHCIDLRLVGDGGDGDGDPGDGDGDGSGETETTGDESGDAGPGADGGDGFRSADGACACTTAPTRPITIAPLGLLVLGLLRRRQSAGVRVDPRRPAHQPYPAKHQRQ